MPDKDLERYQQSPREFREAVWRRLSDWRWVSGSYSGHAWKPLYPDQQRRITEEIAHKLYLNRLRLGKPGDAQSDWEAAEKIVRNSLRSTLFSINQPLIKVEKAVWEPLLAWADNQALLSLLGIIGNIGIIIAVITFVSTEKQRRDAEVLNAWQTLTSAHEQSGSGGRKRALEFLNASPGANWRRKFPWFCAPHPVCTWPAESLDGINLSADNDPQVEQGEETDEEQHRERPRRVYLRGIQLPGASLFQANLQGAHLRKANLQDASLREANLERAYLEDANLAEANLQEANLQGASLIRANLAGAGLVIGNLQGASLREANLQGANLEGANLQGANLEGANLQEASLESVNLAGADLPRANLAGARLWEANLQGADLVFASLEGADLPRANLAGARLYKANLAGAVLIGANLQCADLVRANLKGAYLRRANLKGASLAGSNLQGAKGLTLDQLTQAKLCHTVLPENTTLDPNRDCEKLGIDPETGEWND